MNCPTAVVHVDLSPHAAARIALACELAIATGAHLIGAAATGVSRFFLADGADSQAHGAMGMQVQRLQRQAEQAVAQFTASAHAAGVGRSEQRVCADDAAGALVTLSRCCDLLVLSQADPDLATTGLNADLAAQVLPHVACPVLMVPIVAAGAEADALSPGRSRPALGAHVLLAWNGSNQAARAVRAALPLLGMATRVSIVHLGMRPDSFAAQAPDLLAWLGRHGVAPSLIERSAGADDGDALLGLAMELKASLVVMGAYGHSPFHELLLGGVTRTMLQDTTIPVLLSH